MSSCIDCVKLNLQYQNSCSEFWCGNKKEFYPNSHNTCSAFVSKSNINERELHSREDILTFLNNLLKFAQGISIQPNYTLDKKIAFIVKLREIIYLRDLPILDPNGKWCYKVECTISSLYLNMAMKTQAKSLLKEDEKIKGYGYNLIQLSGKKLTIDEFAELNHTTEGAIRQQLRNGLFPYAKKFGSAWLIPEFSRPVKDSDLVGWFDIPVKVDPFITFNGNEIAIDQHSFITVEPKGRTKENKKFFSITVNNYEPITRKKISSRKYELSTTDKNSFLFYLISNPEISYHSNDIGIITWLFN